MENLAKALVGLAALSFVLAVASSFIGPIAGLPPESFSRACNNMALVGIGLSMVFGGGGQASA